MWYTKVYVCVKCVLTHIAHAVEKESHPALITVVTVGLFMQHFQKFGLFANHHMQNCIKMSPSLDHVQYSSGLAHARPHQKGFLRGVLSW